ncbi:MAG: hypothetical protein MZV64_39140 [Ignavibacteriales bacterium]|nr:hypothetical protein [Ignavibacteriales bacterium]
MIEAAYENLKSNDSFTFHQLQFMEFLIIIHYYENDKLDGVGPYGKAKIHAEEECLKYQRRKECVSQFFVQNLLSVRKDLECLIYFLIGQKMVKGFPMIGNGKNRYQLLDVEDLM